MFIKLPYSCLNLRNENGQAILFKLKQGLYNCNKSLFLILDYLRGFKKLVRHKNYKEYQILEKAQPPIALDFLKKDTLVDLFL